MNAKEAARLLGSIKTKKKSRSSKENGKKGGRPKKSLSKMQQKKNETPCLKNVSKVLG